jgi:hypothetical protein
LKGNEILTPDTRFVPALFLVPGSRESAATATERFEKTSGVVAPPSPSLREIAE